MRGILYLVQYGTVIFVLYHALLKIPSPNSSSSSDNVFEYKFEEKTCSAYPTEKRCPEIAARMSGMS